MILLSINLGMYLVLTQGGRSFLSHAFLCTTYLHQRLLIKVYRAKSIDFWGSLVQY